jgi:hypothetical protein
VYLKSNLNDRKAFVWADVKNFLLEFFYATLVKQLNV